MKRFILILSALFLVSCAEAQNEPITSFSKAKLQEGALLVDVRTPGEFQQGHLDGAQNIDWLNPNFASKWSAVDKNRKIYVYCKVGGRSAQSAQKLRDMGFKHVVNLTGGYDAYLAAKKR
ncbi:MAG: Thiosulfate sulfurtransferase [Bacteroidota bacterium]|jgi:rhodanese-related sulfurtransferase